MNYWMGYKPKWGLFSRIRRNNISARVTVEFRATGAVYAHNDVPLHVYRDFKRSAEKGWFYNRFIKGMYVCKCLKKGQRRKMVKKKAVDKKSRQINLFGG